MKYKTTYLLEVSRVPDHFYALIKGLEGRDILYKNPGSSLRSFVLSGTNVLNEFLELDDQMLEILHECEDFSNDQEIYETINHAMRTQPYDVIEKIIEIGKKPENVREVLIRLNSLNKTIESTWEILKRQSGPGFPINIWSPEASEYKQALIDTKFYTSELVNNLEMISGEIKK